MYLYHRNARAVETLEKECSISLFFFRIFTIMEVTLDLKFEQLKELIKQLPASQLAKLKAELSDSFLKKKSKKDLSKLQDFLLKGPVMSDKQFEAYQKTRKELNEWRKKVI